MRFPSACCRLTAPLVAAVLMAASPVRADLPPPPPSGDTTAIGYIQHVTIGRVECPTCPTRVCPGEPIPVTISGFVPSPCIQFRGFRELPVGAPFTVLMADFVADTCGRPCPAVMVPFSATFSLPGSLASSGSFVLQHQVRSCPDTTTAASAETRQYTYAIEPKCVVPPPLDSLVRSFVSFEIVPFQHCPGDSLTLRMVKNGCHPCVHLSSLSHDSATGFQAVVDWRPLCAELVCNAESLSTPLGAFAAGSHVLLLPVVVRVLDTANPDSTISYTQRIGFEVPRDCGVGPCVEAWLPPRDNLTPHCDVVLTRGGVGSVDMPARTGPAIWGAQGWLRAYHPLRILDVQYAGGAPGTYVTWHQDGDQVRFVAFTTGPGPMIPSGRSDFLRLTIQVDSLIVGDPAMVQLQGLIEQAAGRNGETLPFCAETMRMAPPTLFVCIASPSDTCDANGDGRADVRDLVRMVRCLRPDTTGLDTARVCRDCTGDGAFDLSDLFCCARHILRAPQVPRDSAHASDAVHVAFGEFRREGNGWRVPVRVTGAGALAGSLLRLRYPAERWRADIPVVLAARTDVSADWMPLVDVEQPGVVQLGWLKLGDGQASELSLEIRLTPTGEPRDSDVIRVEGADLVLPDGTTLTPVGDLPAASLIMPSEPPHVPLSLEMSPARPNPFTGTTRFSVSLPRESVIELTVHDVAGRVVATLARGRFAAGVREFEWDGAGAREGVYFARLSVDGHVLSQRVALLRGRH